MSKQSDSGYLGGTNTKQAQEDKDNVYHLFAKHELNADIWMVLNMYPELNVTEISNLVKQSKSTVSRHLNEMEADGFILSREKESAISGRIPSKCYKINPNAFKGQKDSTMGLPVDPVKRLEYIRSEIRMYQIDAHEIQKILEYQSKVMKNLDQEITNVEKADEIFKTYLSGDLEPFVAVSFHNPEEFRQLHKLINDFFTEKRKCCGEGVDEASDGKAGKDYCFFMGTMQLKALFEYLAKKGKKEDAVK